MENLEKKGVNDVWSKDDVESMKAELTRTRAELDEVKQKLQARDGELHEAMAENKALQKRIAELEKKIVSLEASLKEQRTKVETLAKQQQQDKRNIKALENRNVKLESRMDTTDRETEKKFHDHEQRHHKEMEETLHDHEQRHHTEMEEIKQMTRESAKQSPDAASSSKASSTSTRDAATTTTTAMANARKAVPVSQQKTGIVARNRFQSQEAAAAVKNPRTARTVQSGKKSTTVPTQHPPPDLKPGQRNK